MRIVTSERSFYQLIVAHTYLFACAVVCMTVPTQLLVLEMVRLTTTARALAMPTTMEPLAPPSVPPVVSGSTVWATT